MSSEPTRRLSRADDGATAVRGLWSVASRSCFADEIAIDFPSVDAAVDRMRDAFLAPDERPRALSAEISLSAREAFDGAVVPLALPVPGTCQSCGGRGETWTEPCGACEGSGEALVTCRLQVLVPARVGDGTRIRLQVSTSRTPPTRVDVHVTVRRAAADVHRARWREA